MVPAYTRIDLEGGSEGGGGRSYPFSLKKLEPIKIPWLNNRK